MNKNLWPALIIAVLVVGSMIAAPFLSAWHSNSSSPTPTPVPVQKIKFTADSVDANIERMLRIVRIQGYTNETSMDAIVSSLIKLDEIQSLQSNPFFGQPDKNREKFLPFVAEVLVEEKTDFTELKKKIEKEGILSDVSFAVHALIKLPQKIKIKNQDLNLERDYNFSKPFAEALVDAGAMQGDRLKVYIEMELVGDEIASLSAYEEKNLSLMPVARVSEAEAEIVSLEPEANFVGKIRFGGFSVSELEKEIEKIEDVNTAKISLTTGLNSFFIYFSSKDLSEKETAIMKQDINSIIRDVNGVMDVSFDSNADTIKTEVAFERPETLAVIESDSMAGLSKAGLGERVLSIENPLADITGKIKFFHESLKGPVEKVKSILRTRGLTLTLFQPASLKIETLVDKNTGTAFQNTEPVSARLLAGHSIGDTVKAKVSFYTMRDKVLLAQAIEIEQ